MSSFFFFQKKLVKLIIDASSQLCPNQCPVTVVVSVVLRATLLAIAINRLRRC